jgi:hypothetical protein
MKDSEITALAAKAYGDAPEGFSPLKDDGDALRLAVKLRMHVSVYPTKTNVTADGVYRGQLHEADPYAATRRAITRAAAEIGKAMP